MPVKTPPKKQPNAKPQAEASPDQHRTKSAIAPLTQNNVGLPDGWRWVKLGDISEKVESVKRTTQNPKTEFFYLDIGGIDNTRNKILDHKVYTWKDAPSRAQQIVRKNDILFSTVRTYMKNIAIIDREIYNDQIASSGFCVIRAKGGEVDPKYIFYLSLSNIFLQPLNELQTGSSYPAVRDKDVFSQFVPLPHLKAQHAIVSKIEELLSELDKGKQQLETAQQQLKIYRQAVLKWAFEGKLSELGSVGLKDDRIKMSELGLEGLQDDRIDDVAAKKEILQSSNPKMSELGSVGLKDDRISDVAVKNEILQSSSPKMSELGLEGLQDDRIDDVAAKKEILQSSNPKMSELGSVGLKDDRINDVAAKKEILQSSNPKNPNSDNELPQGWKWVKSGELFSYVTSGSRGWAKYYSDNGAIFIRITNMDFDSLELDLTESNIQYVNLPTNSEGVRTKVQEGDFLFSITGYLGMFAIAPKLENAYVNQHVCLCRPKEGFNKKYVGYWIISKSGGHHHLNQNQKGAVKAGLNLDDLKSFPVPLASLAEQDSIVQEIESRLSVCDKVEETITTSLAQAETLRQSILKKAFEGKLV